MRDHIAALQEQVSDLYASLNELRARSDSMYSAPIDPHFSQETSNRPLSIPVSRILPPLISPKRQTTRALPQFHGPTSTVYGLDVAKSSLQTMGITQNTIDDGMMSGERSRATSPVLLLPPHPTKDPLWLIDHTEVVRLLHVYEEEIGIMYPMIEVEKSLKHANSLYKFIQASLRSGFGNPALPGADTIDDEETTVLKLILAITLTVEGHGRSEFGQRFFDAAKPAVDLKLVTALDVKSVVLTVLTVRIPLIVKCATDQVHRLPFISRRMRKHKHGDLLVSPHVCVSKSACIGKIRCSNLSPTRRNSNKLSGYSGPSMLWIGAGVSALACRSHCKTVTLIPLCLSRYVGWPTLFHC